MVLPDDNDAATSPKLGTDERGPSRGKEEGREAVQLDVEAVQLDMEAVSESMISKRKE